LIHQSANFNVTSVTDASGAVQERYQYDPYGQATYLTANWGSRSTSDWGWGWLHQGGRYNAITRLHHFRHRDYSADLGRWMQQDPAGYVDGGNRYQLERNNPVKAVDPFGLRSIVTKPRGRITNLTGGTLPIWNSDVGFGTLGPGQATPIFEDWDFVQVPGGTWVKVRGGCSAMVLPNGSVVSADATLGLGGWALSNWCLIDRNPTRHPGNNFGR
jgi:RHS repeat-associated protein